MAEVLRLSIKRKKVKRGEDDAHYWVPVGTLILFYEEGKMTGGRVEMHAQDEDYTVFVEKKQGAAGAD